MSKQLCIMSTLLEDRRLGWAVLGAITLQGSLMRLGLPGWPCPFRHGLGVPCPGCGLSRAIEALCRADWETAITFHAFAPIIVLALTLLVVASLLPPDQRQKLIKLTEQIEHRTGITAIMLISLLGYWLMRLLIFQEAYFGLIMG